MTTPRTQIAPGSPSRWLAAAHRTPDRAREEWMEQGLALLPLGRRFSAVRLPLSLVLAVTGGTGPSAAVDTALAAVLEGAVICDPEGHRYYALVPPGALTAGRDGPAAPDVAYLGAGTYLGVPRTDRTAYDPATRSSYWAVPMSDTVHLCTPAAVARLITTALSAKGTAA
ncbi:hypothetical protein AB0M23_28150 [Streptomyces sp. NPDC052077]|uniref:hypothetical protein n=1 Tax=Streptomyces sp. NPDC052077 TaxID=3154757 RepID=UPI0034290C45